MFRTPTDVADHNADYYESKYSQGFVTNEPSNLEIAFLKKANFAGTAMDYSYYIDVVGQLGLTPSASIFDYARPDAADRDVDIHRGRRRRPTEHGDRRNLAEISAAARGALTVSGVLDEVSSATGDVQKSAEIMLAASQTVEARVTDLKLQVEAFLTRVAA